MLIPLFCILLYVQSHSVGAVPTNRTIDDTAGDLVTGIKPIYVPSPWQGPSCTGCAIQPPLDQVFMRTYSAFTYMPEKFPLQSIQFSFTGTAVYVFFILANFVAVGVTTETFCTFTLDGNNPETFQHVPLSTPGYQFNSLVYSRENLPNTDHTLLISTSGLNRHVFTSFDYAYYTFDDTPPAPPPSTPSPTPSSIVPIEVSTITMTSIASGRTSSGTASLATTSSGTALLATTSSANRMTVSDSNTSPPSFSSSSSTSAATTYIVHDHSYGFEVGAIVGGVAAGLFVLLACLLIILYRRRRNNASSSTPSSNPTNAPLAIDGGFLPMPIRKPVIKPPAPPPPYTSIYDQDYSAPDWDGPLDAGIDAGKAPRRRK